ncbi:hypothetical protein [Hydrogenimonas cancrithermarum]|uniref:hypothetical protein n=1 Tax=Hydrogenimonas cancrithermarum TaxID=2993563 RepID=UPI002572BEF7|nr:hypothetical protein [Hydrogenimonas cancrithermarum]
MCIYIPDGETTFGITLLAKDFRRFDIVHFFSIGFTVYIWCDRLRRRKGNASDNDA